MSASTDWNSPLLPWLCLALSLVLSGVLLRTLHFGSKCFQGFLSALISCLCSSHRRFVCLSVVSRTNSVSVIPFYLFWVPHEQHLFCFTFPDWRQPSIVLSLPLLILLVLPMQSVIRWACCWGLHCFLLLESPAQCLFFFFFFFPSSWNTTFNLLFSPAPKGWQQVPIFLNINLKFSYIWDLCKLQNMQLPPAGLGFCEDWTKPPRGFPSRTKAAHPCFPGTDGHTPVSAFCWPCPLATPLLAVGSLRLLLHINKRSLSF